MMLKSLLMKMLAVLMWCWNQVMLSIYLFICIGKIGHYSANETITLFILACDDCILFPFFFFLYFCNLRLQQGRWEGQNKSTFSLFSFWSYLIQGCIWLDTSAGKGSTGLFQTLRKQFLRTVLWLYLSFVTQLGLGCW